MPEEEAFAVLVSLMQDFTMRDMYKPDMFYLGLCIYQLECMVQVCCLYLICLFNNKNIFYLNRNFFQIFIDIFKLNILIHQCMHLVGF
jgi:hypothetical protein